jgi:Uncharacterized protein conserved in bacteria (DUF2171)
VSTPVSWLLIERGWTVVAVDGTDVGRVEEVIGDTGKDIFNGLAISTSLLGGARYVPAERVAGITEGQVTLDLAAATIEALGEYTGAPRSEQIRPG